MSVAATGNVTDEERQLINDLDEAFMNFHHSGITFGLKLKEVADQQLYIAMGYKNLEEFVFNRYGFRIRKAQFLISTSAKFKEYGLEDAALEISKMRMIAPRLTTENCHQLVDYAKAHTCVELADYLRVQKKIWRVSVSFNDYDDYLTVMDAISMAKKLNGNNQSSAAAMVAMAQECISSWSYLDSDEVYSHVDPVTLGTFKRDGWTCQGCGRKENLSRHSHLQPHSKANIEDCVTLCSLPDRTGCHNLYEDGKAEIIWLGNGKIRFIKKEESI